MSEPRSCPMCDGGEMVRREGRLEQCGDTYLPTTVMSCTVCGYAEFQPAIGVPWMSDADAPPIVGARRRRAA